MKPEPSVVTAVIPVFNAEHFVGDAIESVLAQTYESLEVVVVDDGSTDGTPQVLASFGAAITVHRQPNRGVAHARNVGISLAGGDFVAFLDADDLWLPEKIARQMTLFSRYPDTGLLYSGYWVVDEVLRPLYKVPAHRPHKRVKRTISLDAWGIGLPFTALVPRAVIDDVGGYRQDLSTSADLEFSHRLMTKYPVRAVPEPLALYRTHSGQMHLNIDVVESDMTHFYDVMFAGEAPVSHRRSRANLHTRLAYARVGAGDLRAGWAHAAVVLRNRPDRLLLAPLRAVMRRLAYRVRRKTRECQWLTARHSE